MIWAAWNSNVSKSSECATCLWNCQIFETHFYGQTKVCSHHSNRRNSFWLFNFYLFPHFTIPTNRIAITIKWNGSLLLWIVNCEFIRWLTFDADHMVTYLLGNLLVGYQFDEIINGVNWWMNTFETLDFLSYRQRIVEKLEIITWIGHFAGGFIRFGLVRELNCNIHLFRINETINVVVDLSTWHNIYETIVGSTATIQCLPIDIERTKHSINKQLTMIVFFLF